MTTWRNGPGRLHRDRYRVAPEYLVSRGVSRDMAKVSEQDLWKVLGNTDTNEGRGATIVLGIFTSRSAADEHAKGKGVFGADATVKHFEGWVVDVGSVGSTEQDMTSIMGSSLEPGKYLIGEKIHQMDRSVEVRQRALQKLSPEERRALGVE